MAPPFGIRLRVVEHRRTTTTFLPFTIRYWIEADPAHGGVDRKDAFRLTNDAEQAAWKARAHWDTESLALTLLDAVPCINSVEVCDSRGTGCAVHRDWP